MTDSLSLIDDLERALSTGTTEKRLQMLWRVTDLFMAGATRYNDDQIGVFDDVMLKLAAAIEARARAKLASRLAAVAQAPPRVVKALAFDDDIAVAEPVLSRSERLEDQDLVDNASTKSQQHLFAITQRTALSEAVTDVLVTRGNQAVVRSVARNTGARFSDAGLRMLVRRANGDDVLAAHVGQRRDIPRHHFLKLLEKASAAVRARLEADQSVAASAVDGVLTEVVGSIRSEMRNASPDYVAAKTQVETLYRDGRLDEAELYRFARERKFEETAVALSLMCNIPIDVVERALLDGGTEMVLILGKVGGCSWTTAKALLLMRNADRGMSAQDLDQANRTFTRLQPETAWRVLHFYHARRKGVEQPGAIADMPEDSKAFGTA
jgi:uncharacterized protein (DUF2336 family)